MDDPRCIRCFEDKLGALVDETVPADQRARVLAAMWSDVRALAGSVPAPVAAAAALARLARETGVDDPFVDEKRQANASMLAATGAVRERVVAADDPFAAAVRASIAANNLDVATPHTEGFDAALERLSRATLAINHVELLRRRAASARSLVFVADNGGEIVLDRLLVEALGVEDTTVVVRGGPAWNDATLEDAEAVGLTAVCRVVDSGDTVPGLVLDRVRPEVRELFYEADLVVAKGQGNYETLCSERRPGLFFVLVTKCEVVAEMIGGPLGAGVVLHAAEHQPARQR